MLWNVRRVENILNILNLCNHKSWRLKNNRMDVKQDKQIQISKVTFSNWTKQTRLNFTSIICCKMSMELRNCCGNKIICRPWKCTILEIKMWNKFQWIPGKNWLWVTTAACLDPQPFQRYITFKLQGLPTLCQLWGFRYLWNCWIFLGSNEKASFQQPLQELSSAKTRNTSTNNSK